MESEALALRAAWDSGREVLCAASHRLVNKPAGLACGSEVDASSEALALEPRLALGSGFRLIWQMPSRASGLVAFVRHNQALPTGLRFGVVVGCGGEAGCPGGRSGAELNLKAEPLGRVGSRALVRVWGDGPLDRLLRCIRARFRVVGDESAAPLATRLLLHVEAVRGALEAHAPVPAEFESWLAGVPRRGPDKFEQALRESLPTRYAVGSHFDAHRLVSEQSGEVAGVSVDRYGAFALLAVSSPAALEQAPAIAQCLMDHGARGVYLKQRLRADLRRVGTAQVAGERPILGEAAPPEFFVRLGSLRAAVRLGDGHSTGLFLDQRDNWSGFGGSCTGRSLLNLFCYTGLFTVGAAVAGASETTSVDLSRAALHRARRNLELCGLTAPHHRLLASDAERWLDRSARQGRRFERIVLDPPSFGTRGRRAVLSLEHDLRRLVHKALRCLEPSQGRLLCINHQRSAHGAQLAQLVEQEAARVHPQASRQVRLLVGPWDCPTLPGVTPTKAMLLRLDGS